MSDQTVLVNISEEPLYLNGFCDLKCDLSFYYQSSTCTIAPTKENDINNKLIYFYENNSNGIPQVLYNGIEYNVLGVYIVLSSIHYYDGNLAEAEIHIMHEAVLGNGLSLDICIPITSSQGPIPNDKGSKMITQMIVGGIEAISLNDTNQATIEGQITSIYNLTSDNTGDILNLDNETSQIEGELPKTRKKRDDSQGININNSEGNIRNDDTKIFSVLRNLTTQLKNDYFDNALSVNMGNVPYKLESIVPVKRPFFSYTNTNNNTYMVVYGMNDAIFIDSSTIEMLQANITPIYTDTNATYNDTVVASNTTANPYPLFLNQTGATSLLTDNLSDEIYIDCQPTGSSTEQTNLTTATTNEPSKTSSVTFFIYVMFFILVLVVIYMLFAYITHPDKKNFSIGNIRNPFV
jgi:hypothetical protein